MKVLLAGNYSSVLEPIRLFVAKFGHEVTVANGDESISKELESVDKYDAVVISTAFLIQRFKKDSSSFILPSVVCSIEPSIREPVENLVGGIFVDKGSWSFVDELRAALDKIAVDIAKKKR